MNIITRRQDNCKIVGTDVHGKTTLDLMQRKKNDEETDLAQQQTASRNQQNNVLNEPIEMNALLNEHFE